MEHFFLYFAAFLQRGKVILTIAQEMDNSIKKILFSFCCRKVISGFTHELHFLTADYDLIKHT